MTCSTASTNFRALRFLQDGELAVGSGDAQPPAPKVPTKITFLAFWLMLMKPPAPASLGPNLLTLRLPGAVDLGEAEKGHVETAAIVEIELIGLVDDGLGVDRRAEIDPACGDAADHARLCRQRDEVDDLLLVGDSRDAFGHADAEIDDAVRLQLERRAARDDLALAHRHRRQRAGAHPDLAAERRIVLRAEGLPVVFRLGHDDAVDQNAGDLDLARIEAAAFGHPLDLRDDDAAGIMRRHGNGERLQRQRLLLHGEIAVGIAGRGADDADVDRERSCRTGIPGPQG